MERKTGLYLVAVALVGIFTIILVFTGLSPASPAQPGPGDGLTRDEYLRISPPPPEDLQGSFTAGSIVLRWDPPLPVAVPHDYSDAITGYSVYRGTIPDRLLYYATTRNLTFTDSALETDTRYMYTVRAVHEGGVESEPSLMVTIRAAGPGQEEELTFEDQVKITPPPPRNLAGTYSGNRITLHWDAPAPVTLPHDYNDTPAGYTIYRGTTPGTISYYATTPYPFFTDREVSGSTAYTYEVTARFDGDRESSPSEEVTVKTTV